MSEFESGTATTAETGKKRQAKEALGKAGDTLKTEAKTFAGVAQDRVRVEAEKGTKAGAKTLGDFANAVRRAGDELAQTDHSPSSRLVKSAADGLENFSRTLSERDPGDLLNDVRDFGRRHPAAFIGGAVLIGLALGRIARASDSRSRSYSDDDMNMTESDSFQTSTDMGRTGSGIDQPVAANVGDLAATNASATATPIGVGEGSSAAVQPGPTSPSTGGR